MAPDGTKLGAVGLLYLSSDDFFSIGVGVAGDKNDLYVCAPASLGEDTACTLGFFWDAGSHGLAGGNVRGFTLLPAGAVAAAQAEPAAGQTLHLPLIARPQNRMHCARRPLHDTDSGRICEITHLRFTEMYATISSGNHCSVLHKLSVIPG